MTKDTQLYYCQRGDHVWYYDEDNETELFYANPGDMTDEEWENVIYKDCRCED